MYLPGLSDTPQDDLGTDSPIDPIKKIAENEVKKQRTLELAIVKSIYPHSKSSDNDNYECDVQLKNGGSELRKVPILTPRIGLTWVPNVNDLVLIGYIGGNVNSPIVMGCLYNDDQRPPTNQAGELIYVSPDSKDSKLKRMYFRFPSGLALLVKDDMVRATAGKLIVTLRSNGELMVDHDGSSRISIDPKDGNISVGSNSSICITGGNQNFISYKGGLALRSEDVTVIDCQKGDIEIISYQKGIKISADTGEIKIKGMKVSIEADTALEIKATTVKINGNAMTEIKGGIVNIN